MISIYLIFQISLIFILVVTRAGRLQEWAPDGKRPHAGTIEVGRLRELLAESSVGICKL